MFAAENWCIKVDDKIYGPYTSKQMRKYAHAGRLSSASMISPAGSLAWREAHKESAFSSFFGFNTRSTPAHNDDSAFGKCHNNSARVRNSRPRSKNDKPEIQSANFILVFDVVNAAASRIEAAIRNLGQAFRIADNVWAVNCDLTAVGVRNAIAPYLRSRESLFVVDTSRGRTSWQNYAPELHAKISAAYRVPQTADPKP